jgi:hypothetical protein
MGGFGSGRHGGKSTTDDCRALDVRRLQRDGLLTPGQSFGWNWTRNGETVASIQIRAEARRVMLNYRHRRTGDWTPMEYPMYLDWTGCNLGGRRPWFLCPVAGCGRRVALLYLGGAGIFACRHCYNLAYESQRETSSDRAGRRANAIRKRLGWTAGVLNLPGGKPKGMQWRTYYRLTARHNELANAVFVGIADRLGMLEGRLHGLRVNK